MAGLRFRAWGHHKLNVNIGLDWVSAMDNGVIRKLGGHLNCLGIFFSAWALVEGGQNRPELGEESLGFVALGRKPKGQQARIHQDPDAESLSHLYLQSLVQFYKQVLIASDLDDCTCQSMEHITSPSSVCSRTFFITT